MIQQLQHPTIKMVFAIAQRFPTINRKELERMLHLTPIEETVIGRELIQLGKQAGRQEGRREGLTKGEVIRVSAPQPEHPPCSAARVRGGVDAIA